MTQLVGACIYGQSGGPTSVINASSAGVFTEALASKPYITKVYAAAYGIEGVLKENLYDMSKEDPKEINLLRSTPASAVGSVRLKLNKEKDLARVLEVFKKYNVRYFFYNGGNDSMDTCNKVSKYLLKKKYECRVIGVPKTIDNDLVGTDHCPGYGSAAKFVASSMMTVNLDSRVYRKGQVTIVEIMGRDAGWLTAAATLASTKGCGPDLLYLPELPFDKEEFITNVREIMASNESHHCLVATSEGIRTKDGKLLQSHGTNSTDGFGHAQLGGVSEALEEIVNKAFPHVKTRSIEFNILQRCASYLASQVDIDEAYNLGRFAVQSAVKGETDKMVAIEREAGPEYKAKLTLVDVTACANSVKTFPKEWILPKHRGVTKEFVDYALPLIQGDLHYPTEDGLPHFAELKKVRVARIESSL